MAEVVFEQDENPYEGMVPTALVELLVENKRLIDEANARLKALDSNRILLERALLSAHLADPSLTTIGTPKGTVKFTPETVYNVNDWDSAFQYIAQNDAFFLVQRRVNSAAIRELLNMGTELPFVSPFERTKVGLQLPRKKKS